MPSVRTMKLLTLAFALVLPLAACATHANVDAAKSAPPVIAIAAEKPAPIDPGLSAPSIDAMLRAEWARARVTPSSRVDDARFLRRVYIDLVGTIPPPDVVVAFVADASPDKRARAVDALLASPAYADHWTSYWDDILMGADARMQNIDRAAFRRWLHAKIALNTPWNDLVFDLVSASGTNSLGGPNDPIAAETTNATNESDADAGVNGAVNWILKYEQTPQDLAGTVSRTFLGVQIQCAQCHDHKTEKWKQADFRAFASCFVRTRLIPLEPPTPKMVRRVEIEELKRTAPRFDKDPDLAPVLAATPRALDGTELAKGPDVRRALGAWITSKDNPWFAKEMVNRIWAHMLGRGFVDPVDDLRPGNPAVASALFDALANDFVAQKYDVKRLLRTIAATEAYQLAVAPKGDDDDPEAKLWGRFRVTPLGPEELVNALFDATQIEEASRKAKRKDVETLRAQMTRQYRFVFDVDEEMDAREFEGTITQALTLMNGLLVDFGGSGAQGTALAEILAKKMSDADTIDAVYLRTLSRTATPSERATWIAYLAHPDAAGAPLPASASDAKGKKPPMPKRDPLAPIARKRRQTKDPRTAAYEDMFWTLLNSSEFVFNH